MCNPRGLLALKWRFTFHFLSFSIDWFEQIYDSHLSGDLICTHNGDQNQNRPKYFQLKVDVWHRLQKISMITNVLIESVACDDLVHECASNHHHYLWFLEENQSLNFSVNMWDATLQTWNAWQKLFNSLMSTKRLCCFPMKLIDLISSALLRSDKLVVVFINRFLWNSMNLVKFKFACIHSQHLTWAMNLTLHIVYTNYAERLCTVCWVQYAWNSEMIQTSQSTGSETRWLAY